MEKALAIQKEVAKTVGTEEVYLVGGSVRDLVLGDEPKDYDFCTPLPPEEITERVKKAGRRVFTIGEKFGTIGFKVPVPMKVVNVDLTLGAEKASDPQEQWTSSDDKIFLHDGFEYVEVTTFRSEVYTSKPRKPEVKFVPSLMEDLARRDFTMNAMVLKPDGTIFDPYGGELDMYAKQIKTVGKPKDRIQEDPLRMLRAARFAARYNFKIDPNFIGKARQLADRIYDVSIERWVQELDKLFTASHLDVGLKALDSMEVFRRIMPEIIINHTSEEERYYDTADEAWKNILMGIHDNPKTARYIASGICARLKFSNARTNFILDKQKKKE